MANWNHIPKAGMEGRTTRTARFATREEVKNSARKGRRNLDRKIIKEQYEN